MAEIIDFVAAAPWLWLLLLVAFAVWVGALWTVATSPKFLRKALWVVLAFLTFTFSWETQSGGFIGVGLPLGALYILWFARFGPSPTPEARAASLVRTAPRTIGREQLWVVRVGYISLGVAFIGMAAWATYGPPRRLFFAVDAEPAFLAPFYMTMLMMGLLFASVLALLVVRPYWWGKLLCALCALGWIGHGMAALAMGHLLLPSEISPQSYAVVPISLGLVALACGIAHQVIDPRFGGSYLRAA